MACVANTGLVRTNPKYDAFTQTTFTVGDSQQYNFTRWRNDIVDRGIAIDRNVNAFANVDDIVMIDSTTWQKYDNATARNAANTFSYMFNKFKRGVSIRISNGKLQFLPFLNARFYSEYADRLNSVDPSKYRDVRDMFRKTTTRSRSRVVVNDDDFLPTDRWLADNAFFRYDERIDDDGDVETIKDLFQTVCDERTCPDMEAFVNLFVNPLLKTNDTEPFNHVWDTNAYPLASYRYDAYSPILSSVTSDEFADLAFPSREDWARARYQSDEKRFPNGCERFPKILHRVPFGSKKRTAVFRDSITGAGFDAATNERLALFELAERLKTLTDDDRDLLDVGITRWNLNPRKYEGQRALRTIDRSSYPTVPDMSLQQRANEHKYIVHIFDAYAPNIAYELSSGSVVIVVGMQRWRSWFSRMLVPYVHYVPVQTINDIVTAIRWCRSHEAECESIVANALQFYEKYLGKEGILDYVQRLFVDVSVRVGYYAYVADPVKAMLEREKYWLATQGRNRDSKFDYAFPLPPNPRNYPALLATLDVFRSKVDRSSLVFARAMRNTRRVTLDRYRFNGVDIVRKRALTDERRAENDHEAYVGLKICNDELVSQTPNFQFVYGLDPTAITTSSLRELAKLDRDSFVEYVPGITLDEWLRSSDSFRVDELLILLLQINLALNVAQQLTGFVHYNLTPRHVIVQKLENGAVEFDYRFDASATHRLRTSLVAVIVDFGKARVCVEEDVESYGVVDHALTHSFAKHSCAYDTLTLMTTVADTVLSDRRKSGVPHDIVRNLLIAIDSLFASSSSNVSRTTFSCARNYERYANDRDALFGDLKQFASYDDDAYFPMRFVRGLMTDYLSVANRVRVIEPTIERPINILQRGNRAYFRYRMRYGNDEAGALREAVLAFQRSTYPTSSNEVLRRAIEANIRIGSIWLHEKIETSEFANVKAMWSRTYTNVINNLFAARAATTTDIAYDLPIDTPYVVYDENVTPEELRWMTTMYDVSPDTQSNETYELLRTDWMSAMNCYAETAWLDPSVGISRELVTAYRFRTYGAVASLNVLRRIVSVAFPSSLSSSS